MFSALHVYWCINCTLKSYWDVCRGVPTYTQSTQMRTKIFQNKKKYMIFLLKQNKIIQMSNVWSEEFSKNNNFAKFKCNFAYIKKCLGTPLVWLMKVNSLYFLLNILFSRAVNLPGLFKPTESTAGYYYRKFHCNVCKRIWRTSNTCH